MIETKKDLDNYIIADYVMNRGYTHPSFIVWIKQILFPDYLMQYLVSMRKFSFYSKKCGLRNKILSLYYQRKFLRLGLKLGYSIDPYVLGYGCVIPHHGTIVVWGGGEYCRKFCSSTYFYLYYAWQQKYRRWSLFINGFSNSR